MKAEDYFDKEYGVGHIETVIDLNDFDSLYGLMEEYAEHKNKELQDIIDDLRMNYIST